MPTNMPTKQELREQLANLGVFYPRDAKKAELEELLAKAQQGPPASEEPQEPAQDTSSTEEPESPAPTTEPEPSQSSPELATTSKASKVTEAWVMTSTGQKAREYTLEVHGENFRALAESYASKIGATVRVR